MNTIIHISFLSEDDREALENVKAFMKENFSHIKTNFDDSEVLSWCLKMTDARIKEMNLLKTSK